MAYGAASRGLPGSGGPGGIIQSVGFSMANSTGVGRGGYRLGAGRKRAKPARGRCGEIQRVVDGIYKGLSLASLKFLPEGSDDERLELTVSAIVCDEVQRGRGAEVLRLLGNLQGITGKGGPDDEGKAGPEGFDMAAVYASMGQLPGLDAPEQETDSGAVEPDDEGLSVPEMARLLRSGAHTGAVVPVMPSTFGPGQDELFELSPGVSITGRH